MIKRENAYFEELKRIGDEYQEAKAERQSRKKQIADIYGWDSEEMKAWYEEDKAATYPISAGACKAYRAWDNSIRYHENEVEMGDFLWDREVQDFVDTLKAAEITTFVYTNQSTAVMENLHQLAAAGCIMQGLCTITRRECSWGSEVHNVMNGIRFTIK